MILMAAELRKKGFVVLYDDFIGSNDQLKKTIETFIGAADIFLVLLSKNSVRSELVRQEVAYALKLKKTILPVVIDDCNIPGPLTRYSLIDFKKGSGSQLNSLISTVALDAGVGAPPKFRRKSGPQSAPSSPRKKSSRGIFGRIFSKGVAKEEEASEPMPAMRSGMAAPGADKPETGVLAHSIPTKMQVQNTHRCIIRIGFDEVTIVKNFPERNQDNIVVKKDIRVSDVMEVEFLPNPHFEISALNSTKQPVDPYDHTEWNFDVKPKSVGAFPLTFKISMFLPNGSKEMILRETVTVITEQVGTGEVFLPSELMTLADYYKEINDKLKIVTMFLASSSELADDREDFEVMIRRRNKNLIKENIYLDLILWEDFLDAMSATRLQDEYNKAIEGCDVFISLFHTKVGMYTEEEFLKALAAFQKNEKPLIYTYFRELDAGVAGEESLKKFKQRLKSEGHFYTRYSNIDELKHKFEGQITKFLPQVLKESETNP